MGKKKIQCRKAPKPLPSGAYEARVLSVRLDRKTGHCVATMEVMSGPHKGRIIHG